MPFSKVEYDSYSHIPGSHSLLLHTSTYQLVTKQEPIYVFLQMQVVHFSPDKQQIHLLRDHLSAIPFHPYPPAEEPFSSHALQSP